MAFEGGGACLTEVLRSLAMEFLAKMRAKVDWVIFFGLGLKIKASRDIRRRLVRAFSWLGLKPKLLLGRRKLKRKACGFLLRPRPLEIDSRVKLKAGDDKAVEPNLGQGETSSKKALVVSAIEPSSLSIDDRAAEPDLGQGETLSEKAPVVSAIESSGKSSPAKSLLRHGFLRLVSSSLHEEEAVLALGSAELSTSGEIPLEWVVEKGKVATHHLSPEKGMLWQGFLLRRRFGEVPERRRLGSPKERLPSSRLVKVPLGMDPISASPNAVVVSLVDSAAASGSPVMSVASDVKVKLFSFPPVLEDAPTYSVHARVSSVPKSSMGFQREAIKLYRISHRELEKRLSIACSIFF